MRIPLIVGNWKMNTTVAEAMELASSMRARLDKIEGIEKVVCPPFISLTAVGRIL
ncbi:MAG: triose-phosphate isomerase, partial [Chloroflexi bacterium]